MKKLLLTLLTFSILLISFTARPVTTFNSDELVILKFSSLNAIQSEYADGDIIIRGLNSSGLPWIIHSAQGRLTASGKLYLTITGLVFDPSDPMVIAKGLGNQNTLSSFRVVVSCRTTNWGFVNTTTDPFPVTTGLASQGGGDGLIETQLKIPMPCIDPVVFVTSESGAWLAATAF